MVFIDHLCIIYVKIYQPNLVFWKDFFHFITHKLISAFELRFCTLPQLLLQNFSNSKIEKHIFLVTFAEHCIGRFDVRMDNIQQMHMKKTLLQIFFETLRSDFRTFLHFEFYTVWKNDEIESIVLQNLWSNFKGWHDVSNHKLLNDSFKILNLILPIFKTLYCNFLIQSCFESINISKSAMTDRTVMRMAKSLHFRVQSNVFFGVRSQLCEEF